MATAKRRCQGVLVALAERPSLGVFIGSVVNDPIFNGQVTARGVPDTLFLIFFILLNFDRRVKVGKVSSVVKKKGLNYEGRL